MTFATVPCTRPCCCESIFIDRNRRRICDCRSARLIREMACIEFFCVRIDLACQMVPAVLKQPGVIIVKDEWSPVCIETLQGQ